jgi:hypothetical protein
MAGKISMRARGEVAAAVAERYRAAGRVEQGRILDELCAVTGWHRKHAIRALTSDASARLPRPRPRRRTYGAPIRDALTALWEASDRLCGKRLVVMIPTLLPALERHARLKLEVNERALVLRASAATIDRLLGDVKIAAAAGVDAPDFPRLYADRFPCVHLVTGVDLRPVIAKLIWWRMEAHRYLEHSSRR